MSVVPLRASEAGRTLAQASAAARDLRAKRDAATAILRASLPPRTTVPLSAEEVGAVAEMYVAMAEVAFCRRELDFIARLVDPRETAVADAMGRLRLAQARLIAASGAVDIDITAVARGVL